ncbi:MAG: septum formation inhibitor Maf [Candidatus Scalindua sp.]|nr:septum formation inhibitor Maf [Candidatus Scalindua sp.]MBT5304147.1 septum formation inhibitor Maf [Candidatus Scalindua sp.]MBT6050871.1 septum formation inhibitor Maf [Candidatus Scalindua sp.]MBT6231388.1 septum formation inhibitor Maf [Candidatus Scalindua sp.]MBT6565038.1 septum formation inhibitor Maf [Candidatus Scalindua sp.]
MKFRLKCRVLSIALFVLFLHYTSVALSLPEENDFHSYWYNHGAEITRFELEQGRYGEIHPGHAILIFVTEPFLPDIHVKADYESSRKKSIPVLKLNLIKRFNTGIYDYSMMRSVFTPIPTEKQQFSKTLKVSTTRQDWCGQVYLQYNLEEDHYKVKQYSYFEKEGDKTVTIPSAYLEDEVWTRIRIAPETLPLGEIKMVPGSFFTTLRMIELGAENAFAELTNTQEGDRGGVSQYTVTYPSLERTLSIRFNKNFPYDILSWSETSPSGSGEDAIVLTTKAKRTHSVMTDYWNKNSVKDLELREELGLVK